MYVNAWAIVAAAAVGGLLSGGAVLLSQALQTRQRRAELRLQERIAELRPLNRDIGAVTERASGWRWSTTDEAHRLIRAVCDVEERGGAIWADREARQALRDWGQSVRILVSVRLEKNATEAQTVAKEATEHAESLIARIEATQAE